MTDLIEQLRAGENLWIIAPGAIALGALHGLEPGHSKTMMAAFIVAVRGTVVQAVLLGLSATISHTAIVWLVAMAGIYFGEKFSPESVEPHLQLASGVIVIGVAAWMFYRIRGDGDPHSCGHSHDHGHAHHHDHTHDHAGHHHDHEHEHHDDHDGHDHQHDDTPLALAGLDSRDAHERAHANEISRRFSNRSVTTGQIVLFGLTGGLIPCPASVTVLLLCLQLKQVTLGATLVFCFSLGLALTLVLSGVLAALSVKHLSKRWSRFETLTQKAPYLSVALMVLVGLYMAWHGVTGLAR